MDHRKKLNIMTCNYKRRFLMNTKFFRMYMQLKSNVRLISTEENITTKEHKNT